MNSVQLRGRMTSDIEVRYSAGADSIAVGKFILAVPDLSGKKVDNKYATDFIKCTTFGKTAENLENYTSQGSEILVFGKLHTDSYKNKDGQKIYTSEVIVNSIEFVSSCGKQAPIAEIPNDFEIPDFMK